MWSRLGQWLGRRTLATMAGVLIVTALLAPSAEAAAQHNIAVEQAESTLRARTTRACPYCAESILSQAILCRYCGRDIEPVE